VSPSRPRHLGAATPQAAREHRAPRSAVALYSERVKRGRILAIKWGMNPNSSSLGVDVTFLLVGATALAMATPVLGALLRWRKPVAAPGAAAPASDDAR
jgi:hypothetical protein